MRIVIIEFMSLDGVVQAPGGTGRRHRRRLRPRRLVAYRLRSGEGARSTAIGPHGDPEVPTHCCSVVARGRRWLWPGPTGPATRSPIR